MFAMLNTQRPPLDDVKVRQAIALAIDWDGLIKLAQGAITAASGVLPSGIWAYKPNLAYKHDMSAATSLLQSAGYGPNGKAINLNLTYITGDENEKLVATALQSNVAPLNININIQPLDWTVLWDKTKGNASQRQDIAIYEWYPDYADPLSWFANLFQTQNPPFFNDCYYSNSAVDNTSNQVETISATDRPKAIQMYGQMQQTIHDDVPAIPMGVLVAQRAMLSNFSGFHENPLYFGVTFVYSLTPD
jgi:peptide/nickel transport system substrate-binding protein